MSTHDLPYPPDFQIDYHTDLCQGIDNLTVCPLYSLSSTWHTRPTSAVPVERSPVFSTSQHLVGSCHDALSDAESLQTSSVPQ
jgi:hypothetical protein